MISTTFHQPFLLVQPERPAPALHLCLPNAPIADFKLSPHLGLAEDGGGVAFLPSDDRLLWSSTLEPENLRLVAPVDILPSRLETMSMETRLVPSPDSLKMERGACLMPSAAAPFSCVFFGGGGDDLAECAGLTDPRDDRPAGGGISVSVVFGAPGNSTGLFTEAKTPIRAAELAFIVGLPDQSEVKDPGERSFFRLPESLVGGSAS